MCSEKAELDDTSGPHVGKDSNKGTCEELTVDETMSWYVTEKQEHS